MNIKDIQKVEFWIGTGVFLFSLALIFANTLDNNFGHLDNLGYNFKEQGYSYSRFFNYFMPEFFRVSLLYTSFLLLNFIIIPRIVEKKNEVIQYLLIFLLFAIIGLITSITYTYRYAYELGYYRTLQSGYNHLFFKGYNYAFWMVITISAYSAIKYLIIYFNEEKEKNGQKQHFLKLDLCLGLAFWLIVFLLWIASHSSFQIAIVWTIVAFGTIGIVVYSIHYLLPQLVAKGGKFKNYWLQMIMVSMFTAIPMVLIAALFFFSNVEAIFVVLLFHFPTQLLISAPLSWYIYKRRLANSNEIFSLKKELGKSDASLSFLQSQINPHFLFNALNTLYGTALQENAERTGEGIQKLGDMMRFMLHENVQDRISLTKDVDYLENYISLQKLRISRSFDIVVETSIEAQVNSLQITPMLLIPFVENAFKHGISLVHPSHIKITLQTRENVLYFDVHNSIHLKPDHDPEKLKSGIGLANVKQRLALLYPNEHELLIRESAKEFFIHLTIKL